MMKREEGMGITTSLFSSLRSGAADSIILLRPDDGDRCFFLTLYVMHPPPAGLVWGLQKFNSDV